MVLLYLITAADWIKLAELAYVFSVSDSTVSSDITSLDALLPESFLIERQKGVGVRVVGSEISLRLAFIAAFPALFPLYTLEFSSTDADAGCRRAVNAMGLPSQHEAILSAIGAAEEVLGLTISPAYTGVVYGYLFVLHHRLAFGTQMSSLPGYAVEVPQPFFAAAEEILGQFPVSDPDRSSDVNGSIEFSPAETELLARILSSCEVAAPPGNHGVELIGTLRPLVEEVIERTLGVLEEKEQTWLHDDRALLDYLRMTIAAAIRRLDLRIPRWHEFVLHPYPMLEDTPEGAALCGEFLFSISPLISGLVPKVVHRELTNVVLAISARIETIRQRRAAQISVRILCYEGLGMSNYLRALVREVLPHGARIDARWDPDFVNSPDAARHDLVVSTYPLQLHGVAQLVIEGDSPPDVIRSELREALQTIIRTKEAAGPGAGGEREETVVSRDDGREISLPAIMTVVNNFFVESRVPGMSLIDQVVGAVDRGDCEPEILKHDFERRESYGSLVFEELHIRLVHCRTHGVPEPRAGVIQTGADEPAVLVLAAPVTAPHNETRVLSELVVALTETPDFPRVLAEENLASVQRFLLALFSRVVG